MDRGVREGIRLFNARKFFEAHEALEAVWLKAQGDEKVLLHGLIQIAAAFHHYTRQNPTGFCSLLEKGLSKIARFGSTRDGINLNALRTQLQPWRGFRTDRGRAEGTPAPALPRILRAVRQVTSDK